jgi:hypothetical protein
MTFLEIIIFFVHICISLNSYFFAYLQVPTHLYIIWMLYLLLQFKIQLGLTNIQLFWKPINLDFVLGGLLQN